MNQMKLMVRLAPVVSLSTGRDAPKINELPRATADDGLSGYFMQV